MSVAFMASVVRIGGWKIMKIAHKIVFFFEATMKFIKKIYSIRIESGFVRLADCTKMLAIEWIR